MFQQSCESTSALVCDTDHVHVLCALCALNWLVHLLLVTLQTLWHAVYLQMHVCALAISCLQMAALQLHAEHL
jgi:hypothetical protein